MTPTRAYLNAKNSGIEWVGTIPEHWRVLPFYSFVDEVSTPNKGLIERNLLSLSYGRIVRKDIDQLEGLTPASFEGYNIVEANDIVFRLTDLQNDQTSLRSARATERGIVTSAYVTVRPSTSARFFEYLMRAYDTTKVFYGIGGGIRQSMNFADLKRLPVIVPPSDEMETIASHLDSATARISNLVSKKIRFIELLREKRRALITHAVTKGLHPGVPMKEIGVKWLGKVPKHWNVVPVWAMYRPKKETGHPEMTLLSVYRDFGVIERRSRDDNKNRESEDLSGYQLVDSGDLVTNKMKTWQGSIAISGLRGIVSPAYYVYRKLHDENDSFLHHLFRSAPYITGYQSISKGIRVGQWDLEADKFRLFPVLIPPIEEQQSIATYIARAASRIDTLIEKTERSIELLREHLTALIVAAVTGKINVILPNRRHE